MINIYSRRTRAPFWIVVLASALAAEPTSLFRWSESATGCTFSADADGKYRYGLWTDDFAIVLAIDAGEVHKADQRVTRIFAVFLTIRDRGKNALAVDPRIITLEFVDHYHQVQTAADPNQLVAELQDEVDAYAARTQTEISRHPERKEQEKHTLEAYQRASPTPRIL